MSTLNTIAQHIAVAVKARRTMDTSIYGHSIAIWYDSGIPILTISRTHDGVIFEEAASDKPEINQAMLVGFLC